MGKRGSGGPLGGRGRHLDSYRASSVQCVGVGEPLAFFTPMSVIVALVPCWTAK